MRYLNHLLLDPLQQPLFGHVLRHRDNLLHDLWNGIVNHDLDGSLHNLLLLYHLWHTYDFFHHLRHRNVKELFNNLLHHLRDRHVHIDLHSPMDKLLLSQDLRHFHHLLHDFWHWDIHKLLDLALSSGHLQLRHNALNDLFLNSGHLDILLGDSAGNHFLLDNSLDFCFRRGHTARKGAHQDWWCYSGRHICWHQWLRCIICHLHLLVCIHCRGCRWVLRSTTSNAIETHGGLCNARQCALCAGNGLYHR
mmetsp:Transcript_41354/g.74828  ORF Transcript_41354/g.74828 Transcript_41354/m.74828 type:complete len:250 (-) Transcript_41354:282-1031(-)